MIENSRNINNIFRMLYESDKLKTITKNSFEYVMKSNESRLDYLNRLFKKIKNNELNRETSIIFDENIDYIYSFINGEYNNELTVPKKYFDDKETCLIIPTEDDLDYLFKLIEANKKMYEMLYKNNKIIIDLPKKTFNQNMTRILSIEEHNLAHLLGLTESESTLDPNKNILKKYFLSHIKDNEKYGDKISERLLNWILSDEGKKELRRINKITIDFINKDKKKYPNNYDSKSQIKEKSLEKFKIRFKQENGFDYPIIKFSRYITKSINLLNFLNMNNIIQIILDYNAPEGKENEQDIFIINSSFYSLMQETKDYVYLYNIVLDVISKYVATDDLLKKKIKGILDEIGIDIDDKNINSYINLIQTYDYVGKHGIIPNQNIALEKIRSALNNCFNRNIHMIGFNTEFNGQIINLKDSSVNKAHCDTSVTLTTPELVGEYYKRGRSFFIDKVYEEKGNNLIRLSIPQEEILYLEYMNFLEPNNIESSNKLKTKLSKFQKNYHTYINQIGNKRKK